MSMVSKVFLIILDGMVWLSSIVTVALCCSLMYLTGYYIKENRTETDPFDRKMNREHTVICGLLGFACLGITAVLAWVAMAIMRMI